MKFIIYASEIEDLGATTEQIERYAKLLGDTLALDMPLQAILVEADEPAIEVETVYRTSGAGAGLRNCDDLKISERVRTIADRCLASVLEG